MDYTFAARILKIVLDFLIRIGYSIHMKAKKTVNVSEIKEKANSMFAISPVEKVDERKAVATFVSDILHRTGNYRGFNYLPSESDIHAGFYGKDCRIFFY